ncbi:MAG: hypothetical protein WCI92_02895 [Bacteroidota bacterium]
MNRNLKNIIFLLLAIASASPVFAQDDERNIEIDNTTDGRGWTFGLNLGVYYPSKSTANYYNGNPWNENNAQFVMSNYTWYNEIFHSLQAHDTVYIDGLPQNMHYTLTMQPGIYAQYSFNPELALIIEFNYMLLKTNDAISFKVDPLTHPSDKNPSLLYPIRGAEERVYADIGLKRNYIVDKKLSYFAMGGLNVNSTKAKKCAFYVEDIEYSMVNNYVNGSYVPNGNSQTYGVYQGGIGIGMFAGGGLAFTFGNGIVLEPGITAHWLMVKLHGYQNMNPGAGAYVRFLF